MPAITRLRILAVAALALVSVGGAATASGASKPQEPSAVRTPSHASRATLHVGDMAKESGQASCADPPVQVTEADRSPRGRLRLAACKARNGKMMDALREEQEILKEGIVHKDADVMAMASESVTDLVSRLPHVAFEVPRGVTSLKVMFDGRSVARDQLSKTSAVDPGRHRIIADGLVRGVAQHFEADVEITEQQLATIRLDLARHASP